MDDFCQWPVAPGKGGGAKKASPVIDLGYPRDVDVHYDFPRGKQLGKGGFGVVRLVQRKSTGETFACKEIAKTMDPSLATPAKQKRHIENIQREVAVLKTLKGSLNVVNLEAVYEDDEKVYIIMECCFGGELIHTIGIRPYSEQTVAKIMKAVLRTLAQCHERGILHRDVKPGNFMLLRQDVGSPIKAVDFGLAVFYEEKELPRRDLGFDGTPWFMAPEVLSSQVVPASDVWSAGVMAYQLLSGFLPFDDKKSRHAPALSAVWKSVLTDEPDFRGRCWNDISEEAKDFIKKLLNKDPKKRPTAEEALSHAWIERGPSRDSIDGNLPYTIVQRIQRFGQSSLFKRTVLDMIANELLQSYIEKTRYNEKQFQRRCAEMGSPGGTMAGGSSEYGQTKAMDVLKGIPFVRRWGSMADLPGGSPMSIDEWEVVRRASRLALDTSQHGSERFSNLDGGSFSLSSPPVDTPFLLPAADEHTSVSPSTKPVSLQAVLEDKEEPMPDISSDRDPRLRGRSLIKDLLEAQGTSMESVTSDPEPTTPLNRRAQRIEYFLKSMFGVNDANETRKVMEFLDFGVSSNISEKEFVEGLEKLGYNVDESEVPYLVEIMAPGSNHVNFTQFVASQIDWECLQHTHRDTWLACVRHAFESIDKDKDGTLSAADILSAIAEKLPNKEDIDAALEQARAEACAAELNMSFEDFLAVLRDDRSSQPLKNFDSRFNAHPTSQ